MLKKKYIKEIVLINNDNEEDIKNKIKMVEDLAKISSYLILTEYRLESNTLTVTTDFMSSCKDLELPVSPKQIKSLIEDVIKGLKELEGENLYHGSIKPSNILCGNEKFILCHYYLKGITDSYFANIETIKFQSPEALKDDGLSIESDMWSLGCVLFYLYCGTYPFEYNGSLEDLTDKIINNKRNKLPLNIEKDTILILIDNLIEPDKNKRYSLATVSEALESTKTEINEKKDMVYLKCNKYVTDYKYKQNGVFYHVRNINYISRVLIIYI